MTKLTIRAGLVGLAATIALAGCGKKEEQAPAAGRAGSGGRASRGEGRQRLQLVRLHRPEDAREFTKETGIKVNYDVFDNNEVLETKLLAGNTGYDVVVPSASFLEVQIKAGVFRKLDRSKLPNWRTWTRRSWSASRSTTRATQYSVNYMWGTDGIGYNEEGARRSMPEAPRRQLGDDFRSGSGLEVQGLRHHDPRRPGEVVGAVLAYLGKDPNSENPTTISRRPREVLMTIRPYVRTINSSEYINALANGDICLALGWSGDILQARDRAEEAGRAWRSATRSPRRARSSGSTCSRSRPMPRIRTTPTPSSTT